jgi:hypothetical protein
MERVRLTLDQLRKGEAAAEFAGAFSPKGCEAGLWLHYGCWDEAHQVAQELNTAEGSYWHAIVHRREPDPGNSAYWFRQTGKHPVREAVTQEMKRLGIPMDPPTETLEQLEWEMLFDYCARGGSGRV